MRLIVPLTPNVCFVTLSGLEQQKPIIPRNMRVDEDLGRRISLVLIHAAAEEFLSHPNFIPLEGNVESPNDLLEDIAEILEATTEDEDIF